MYLKSMLYLLLYTGCTGSYVASASGALDWSVQWNVRGDEIDFVVSAVTMGWVAIGFSEDTLMVTTYTP